MVRVLNTEVRRVGPLVYVKRRALARILASVVRHVIVLITGWAVYYYPGLLRNDVRLIAPLVASWVTLSVNTMARVPWMIIGKWLRSGRRVQTELFVAACKPAISVEAHVRGKRRVFAMLLSALTFMWLYIPDQIVSVSITEAERMAMSRLATRDVHAGPIGGGTNMSGSPIYDISGLQMLAEDNPVVDAAVFIERDNDIIIPLSPQEASLANTTYYRLTLKDWPGIRLIKSRKIAAPLTTCKTEDEAEKFEFAMGSMESRGKLIHTVVYNTANEQGRSGIYSESVEVQNVRMDVKFSWEKDRVVVKRIENVVEESTLQLTRDMLESARIDMCKAFANVVHYGTKRSAKMQVSRTHVATIVRTGTGETWSGFGNRTIMKGQVDARRPGVRAPSVLMFLATGLSLVGVLLSVIEEVASKLDNNLMSISSNMSGLVNGRRLCSPKDVRLATGAVPDPIGSTIALEIALQGCCPRTNYEVGHLQLTDGTPRRNTEVVVDLRGQIRVKKRKRKKKRKREVVSRTDEQASDLSGLIALSISRLAPDRYKGREHEAIRRRPDFRKLARPEFSLAGQ
uniref:Uncharacterized protein n=1 Tax=Red algae totivirus 1 TaxID=2706914 RepID=A0A6J4BTL6_9VIRU|nr:hypothetical protein [Red algae totivirus 1]